MIVHVRTPKTRESAMPYHLNKVPGLNLTLRKRALVKQLAAIDGLLACTRSPDARASLNSSRNMVTEAMAFCDAAILRAFPSYQ